MHKVPKIVRSLFPSLLWQVNTKQKQLYLSFDDGPVPEATPFVLKTLKDYQAKATFFCIGDNIRKHPKLFEQILEEGHQVGNHTFNHLNGWETPLEHYLENTERCQKYIGDKSSYFRPPYGRLKPSQIKALKAKGYAIIMWSSLSKDYDKTISPETCLKNTIEASKVGSIVLFHDSIKAYKNMSYALPRFLSHFKELGFEFKTL